MTSTRFICSKGREMLQIYALYVLVIVIGLSGVRTSRRSLSCLDNRVGRDDFHSNIATMAPFNGIYTVEINSPETFGKTVNMWFNTSFIDYNTLTFTRNLNQSKCEDLRSLNASLVEKHDLKRSKCCHQRGKPVSESYIMLFNDETGQQERFFSQDVNKYFWWFECLNGTVHTFESCDYGFFDLQIPDNPQQPEIDLTGIPWDKVAEDLEDFTGLQFGDLRVIYAWLGVECPDK